MLPSILFHLPKVKQQEKLNENDEGGYKIQLTRCLFFKKANVKAEKEEKLTH
jgi:hypothetical protein